MSEIVCFKIIGGDDIIAKVLDDAIDHFVVENPAAIVLQRGQDGQVGVGLAPWLPFAEGGRVTIAKSALAARCDIDTNLRNEYSRLFSDGIQIAPASALAGLR